MDAVISAIRVIVPIYLLISAGYLSKKAGLFSRNTLKEMNHSVFRLFLPMLLFENMYQSDVKITDMSLIAWAAGCVFVIYVFCSAVIPLFEKDRARAATVIQGMYRSNFALMGIALTETMYGSGETQVTGMLAAVIVPLYNVLAVILFERFCGNGSGRVSDILPGILRNPLIIGTVLGLLANISGVIIPEALNSAVVSLGQTATPLALTVMGGTFELRKTVRNRKTLGAVVMARLILIPVLFSAVSAVAGYRGKALYALFLMFATPAAVSSYSMACAMGGDEDLAGEIVLLTTVLSLFSIGTGIFVMKMLQLI